MKRALILLALATGVSGCATIKGWFNDSKSENIEPPTVLVEFAPTINVQKLWSERVGKGAQTTGARMTVAYADGKLYAASTSGDVEALDAATGHTLWSKHNGQGHGWIWHHGDNSVRWSGGPSVSGDLVVVGTLEGTVHALAASDGTERWTVQLSSEVISAPAVSSDIVAVRTHDGRVFGLDARDGKRMWVFDHTTVPILSLRGNSSPIIDSGIVYVGEDNGKVVAIRANDGGELWEQQIAPGEGRSEIERIQDVDGTIAFDRGVVYASGYRGQTAALIAQSGRPLWTHELSSFSGVALSATKIFVSDADSSVWALELRTGSSEWRNEKLKYRWLSVPAVQGEAVVVGDAEGFVHWLSINDGEFVARQQLSKDPIEGAPIVVDDVVYVMDIAGQIAAYRVGK